MTLLLALALFHPEAGTQVVNTQRNGVEITCFWDSKAKWATQCFAVREVLEDDGFLTEGGGRML